MTNEQILRECCEPCDLCLGNWAKDMKCPLCGGLSHSKIADPAKIAALMDRVRSETRAECAAIPKMFAEVVLLKGGDGRLSTREAYEMLSTQAAEIERLIRA